MSVGKIYLHDFERDVGNESWEVYSSRDTVTVVVPDRSGSRLAYAMAGGVIELWDTRTVPVALCELPALPLFADLEISGMCFSEDGSHLGVYACRKDVIGAGGRGKSASAANQVLICNVFAAAHGVANVVVASSSVPFGVWHMDFWGGSNTTLLLGAQVKKDAPGAGERYLLSVSPATPGASASRAVTAIRELTVVDDNGRLRMSPTLTESALAAASNFLSDSSNAATMTLNTSCAASASSGFAFNGNSMFLVAGGALFEYALVDGASEAPRMVKEHRHLGLKADGSTSVGVVRLKRPSSLGSAYLLLVSEDSLVHVVSLEGIVLLRFGLPVKTVVCSHGWLDETFPLENSPAPAPTGSGSETAITGKLMVAVRRGNEADQCAYQLVYVDVQGGGNQYHYEELHRQITHKVVICAASPNPHKLFNVYGIDSKDQCWALSSRYRSDFPGPMYPVGFKVIKQCITYQESEDDCDNFVSGIEIRSPVTRDPLTEMKPPEVRLNVGSSFRRITPPPPSFSGGALHFSLQQMNSTGDRLVLSVPKLQLDVLGYSGAEADAQENPIQSDQGWEMLKDAKPATKYLRPPESVLNGDFLRKLAAKMRHGDETYRICENELKNTGDDALDYLIPEFPEFTEKEKATIAAAEAMLRSESKPESESVPMIVSTAEPRSNEMVVEDVEDDDDDDDDE